MFKAIRYGRFFRGAVVVEGRVLLVSVQLRVSTAAACRDAVDLGFAHG